MPQQTEINSEELVAMLEDASFNVSSYSGRGMYGKECVAVKHASLWGVARLLPSDHAIPEPCTDTQGHGTVIYWPSFAWPEGRKANDIAAVNS